MPPSPWLAWVASTAIAPSGVESDVPSEAASVRASSAVAVAMRTLMRTLAAWTATATVLGGTPAAVAKAACNVAIVATS